MTTAPYPLARRREWSRAQALAWVHYRSLAAVQRIAELEAASEGRPPLAPELLLVLLLAVDNSSRKEEDRTPPRRDARKAVNLLSASSVNANALGRLQAADVKTAFPRATGKEKGRAKNAFAVAQWKLDVVVPFLLANTYKRGLLRRFCEDHPSQRLPGKWRAQSLVGSPKDFNPLARAAIESAAVRLAALENLTLKPLTNDSRVQIADFPVTPDEIRERRKKLDSWR